MAIAPVARSRSQEGGSQKVLALVAGTAVAGGAVAVCSADHVHSVDYGWSHHGLLSSYDYARCAPFHISPRLSLPLKSHTSTHWA